MKKIIAVLIMILMVFNIVGCSNSERNKSDKENIDNAEVVKDSDVKNIGESDAENHDTYIKGIFAVDVMAAGERIEGEKYEFIDCFEDEFGYFFSGFTETVATKEEAYSTITNVSYENNSSVYDFNFTIMGIKVTDEKAITYLKDVLLYLYNEEDSSEVESWLKKNLASIESGQKLFCKLPDGTNFELMYKLDSAKNYTIRSYTKDDGNFIGEYEEIEVDTLPNFSKRDNMDNKNPFIKLDKNQFLKLMKYISSYIKDDAISDELFNSMEADGLTQYLEIILDYEHMCKSMLPDFQEAFSHYWTNSVRENNTELDELVSEIFELSYNMKEKKWNIDRK